MIEVGLARGRRDQDEAEGEHRREDDADRSVLLDPAGAADHPDQDDGEEAEDHGAEGEGQVEDIGQSHSR